MSMRFEVVMDAVSC